MDSVDIAFFKILKGYSSLVPPKSLTFPSHLSLAEVHEFFLRLLLHPHLQRYPPSQQYQKSFWKWTIQCLEELFSENDSEEIDPRFYEYYLNLTSSYNRSIGSPEIPSQSYFTYYWMPPDSGKDGTVRLDRLTRITLLESRTIIESGTTGLRTWKASFLFADYLLNNPELVQGKSVLELGSGVGFLGTVVAAIQQSNVLPGIKLCLTDVNEQVLSRCNNNVKLSCNLSSLHPHIQCQALDWSLSLAATPSDLHLRFLMNESSPDIILGADIVFDPSLVPALVGLLKLCISTTIGDRTKVALVAVTVRNCSTMALFMDSLKGLNLHVEEVQLCYQQSSFVESFSVDNDENVKLFQITE